MFKLALLCIGVRICQHVFLSARLCTHNETFICSRLLDLLAGRKETGTIFGEVLLDGFTLPEDFKCMSGYVVQVRIVTQFKLPHDIERIHSAISLIGRYCDGNINC